MLGAFLGFGVQCMSNAMRKYPLYRHPWEHVLAIGVGGWFAGAAVSWTDGQREQLEQNIQTAKQQQKRAEALGIKSLAPRV